MSVSVKSDIEPFLDAILKYVKEGLSLKGKYRTGLEKSIYHCVSKLAIAVGQALSQYSHDLLDLMLAGGLTEPLCSSLASISANVPPMKATIKERLLNTLSIILSGHPYHAPGDPRHKERDHERGYSTSTLPKDGESEKNSNIIILALTTLADFEYSGRLFG